MYVRRLQSFHKRQRSEKGKAEGGSFRKGVLRKPHVQNELGISKAGKITGRWENGAAFGS